MEFFRSPFLVQEWETPDANGSTKETLRLDLVERQSDKYKSADVLVFNTGHWWTHEKTAAGYPFLSLSLTHTHAERRYSILLEYHVHVARIRCDGDAPVRIHHACRRAKHV